MADSGGLSGIPAQELVQPLDRTFDLDVHAFRRVVHPSGEPKFGGQR